MVLQKQELIRETIYYLVKLSKKSSINVTLDEEGILTTYERIINSETVIQSKNCCYIKSCTMSDSEIYEELASLLTKLKELDHITEKSTELLSRKEPVESEDLKLNTK